MILLPVALLFTSALIPFPLQHGEGAPPVDPDSKVALARPIGRNIRPVTSFGAISLDGWVYVQGGYFGRPHAYMLERQSSHFYRFRVDDPTVVELLPNEVRGQSVQLETAAGQILSFGAMIAHNASGEDQRVSSSALCRSYDPEEQVWRNLPAFPTPRSSHDVAVIGSKVYVVGGWNLVLDGRPQWCEENWVLDLEKEEEGWQAFPVPDKRRAVGACSIGSRVIMAGGITSKGDISSRVDVYDAKSGSWTRGPDLPAEGFGVAIERLGDQVMASTSDGQVWSLSVGAEEWLLCGQLVYPRFFHQIVRAQDGLIALGGTGVAGLASQMEYLVPRTPGAGELTGAVVEAGAKPAQAVESGPSLKLGSTRTEWPGGEEFQALVRGHELLLLSESSVGSWPLDKTLAVPHGQKVSLSAHRDRVRVEAQATQLSAADWFVFETEKGRSARARGSESLLHLDFPTARWMASEDEGSDLHRVEYAFKTSGVLTTFGWAGADSPQLTAVVDGEGEATKHDCGEPVRGQLAFASGDRAIYVLEGSSEGESKLRLFGHQAREWGRMPSLPQALNCPRMVRLGDHLYCIDSSEGSTERLHRFDLERGQWVESIPFERKEGARADLVVYRGRLLLVESEVVHGDPDESQGLVSWSFLSEV